MPRMILRKTAGISTICANRANPGPADRGARSAIERWKGQKGLRSAAMHCAIGGQGTIEYGQWREQDDAVQPKGDIGATSESQGITYYARTLEVRAGPRLGGGALELVIDPERPRPTLIGVFRSSAPKLHALIDYLRAASVRLAAEVDGWIGAVLLQSITGCTVIEYLQFETMDAVAATQHSPVVTDHQARLQDFAAIEVGLYMPSEVFVAEELQCARTPQETP